MCKTYITNHRELSDLEREAIASKFRQPSRSTHRAIFHQGSKTMTLAAPYNAPLQKTRQAVQGLVNLYKPQWVEIVALPRGVA